MVLIPNIPFTEGDLWTPELAYEAFNTPVFDDQPQYLGHRNKLQDSELSAAPGAIKSRVAAIEDGFKVTPESGLTVRYATGIVKLTDGSVLSKPSGLLVCPDNSTAYVYLDVLGNVGVDTNPPVIRLLLAKVTTVGGQINTIEDYRNIAIRAIQPVASAIKIFGGSNQTDKLCSNGEVFDLGYYYFRDFTVPAGITITIDKFARIYCSGKVTISGTVNVTTAASGGVGFSSSASTGVTQGGGSGSGAGGGSGSANVGGRTYNFAAQAFGSGGGIGLLGGNTSGIAAIGNGGDGGGGFWVEAAKGITVTGSIFTKGSNATASTTISGTPSVSGSGGGSGGLILLSSLESVTVSGTLDVRGGNGSNSIGDARGGGGGGGGFLVLMAPTINTTGWAPLLAGGTAGTSSGSTLGGGSGGGFGGAGGISNIATVPAGAGRMVILNVVPIGS